MSLLVTTVFHSLRQQPPPNPTKLVKVGYTGSDIKTKGKMPITGLLWQLKQNIYVRVTPSSLYTASAL